MHAGSCGEVEELIGLAPSPPNGIREPEISQLPRYEPFGSHRAEIIPSEAAVDGRARSLTRSSGLLPDAPDRQQAVITVGFPLSAHAGDRPQLAVRSLPLEIGLHLVRAEVMLALGAVERLH